jgi:hypothetical protein
MYYEFNFLNTFLSSFFWRRYGGVGVACAWLYHDRSEVVLCWLIWIERYLNFMKLGKNKRYFDTYFGFRVTFTFLFLYHLRHVALFFHFTNSSSTCNRHDSYAAFVKIPHSQKWWVLCSFAYLRWRRRDVCHFHMIYIDDIIHNCMCVIFWTWKWYIESSWIKWNKN